ncbi:MAG TPA: helix-turn-helix transcriptional regulator [Caulobacteraceae bacterium]
MAALRQHVDAVQEREAASRPVRFRLRPASNVPKAQDHPLHSEPSHQQVTARQTTTSIRQQITSAPLAAADQFDASSIIREASDLGRLIRRHREQRGLTQLQLSKSAGTGRRFVSELEGGKPTLELGRVLAVCRAVGVSLFAAGSPDG